MKNTPEASPTTRLLSPCLKVRIMTASGLSTRHGTEILLPFVTASPPNLLRNPTLPNNLSLPPQRSPNPQTSENLNIDQRKKAVDCRPHTRLFKAPDQSTRTPYRTQTSKIRSRLHKTLSYLLKSLYLLTEATQTQQLYQA